MMSLCSLSMLTCVTSSEPLDNLWEISVPDKKEIEPQSGDVIHLWLREQKEVKPGFKPRGVWLQSQNS